jgi:hypothetical protein
LPDGPTTRCLQSKRCPVERTADVAALTLSQTLDRSRRSLVHARAGPLRPCSRAFRLSRNPQPRLPDEASPARHPPPLVSPVATQALQGRAGGICGQLRGVLMEKTRHNRRNGKNVSYFSDLDDGYGVEIAKKQEFYPRGCGFHARRCPSPWLRAFDTIRQATGMTDSPAANRCLGRGPLPPAAPARSPPLVMPPA